MLLRGVLLVMLGMLETAGGCGGEVVRSIGMQAEEGFMDLVAVTMATMVTIATTTLSGNNGGTLHRIRAPHQTHSANDLHPTLTRTGVKTRTMPNQPCYKRFHLLLARCRANRYSDAWTCRPYGWHCLDL